MPTPQLSKEQRQKALESALATRQARAEICKKVADGKLTCAQVFNMTDDPVVGRIRVKSFIKLFPGYGDSKAARLMEELNIADSRRLAGLGVKQRAKLLQVLG